MTIVSSTASTQGGNAIVLRLFKHWQLSPAREADLLGLRSMIRNDANRLLEGDAACAVPHVELRVGYLLEIHCLLRLWFPQNRELAYRWMSARNHALGDRTSVVVIHEQGVDGLLLVRSYLSGSAGD